MLIFGKKVWRVLRELRNGDQAREIAQVRAFVIEFHKPVVLAVIAGTKWL